MFLGYYYENYQRAIENVDLVLSKEVVVVVWSLSPVQLFVTPWTVAGQALLSMGIFQARILEWVAIPSSKGSSQPKDQTQVSRLAGRFFTS